MNIFNFFKKSQKPKKRCFSTPPGKSRLERLRYKGEINNDT